MLIYMGIEKVESLGSLNASEFLGFREGFASFSSSFSVNRWFCEWERRVTFLMYWAGYGPYTLGSFIGFGVIGR